MEKPIKPSHVKFGEVTYPVYRPVVDGVELFLLDYPDYPPIPLTPEEQERSNKLMVQFRELMKEFKPNILVNGKPFTFK